MNGLRVGMSYREAQAVLARNAADAEAQALAERDHEPVVPLATSLAIARCPHRSNAASCGCEGRWKCDLDPAAPRDVSWIDCRECIERGTSATDATGQGSPA